MMHAMAHLQYYIFCNAICAKSNVEYEILQPSRMKNSHVIYMYRNDNKIYNM